MRRGTKTRMPDGRRRAARSITAWDVQPRCRFGAKMLKIEVPYTVSHLNNHAHVLEYIIVQPRSPQYGRAG